MGSNLVGGRVATPTTPLRCAVFISGSGSGMEALVNAQRSMGLPHETVLVVSNKPNVPGLERASRLGLPSLVVEHRRNGENISREEHELEIIKGLADHDVELIVLAGYMRLLSPVFLNEWQHRVVNIHPSLLPHFPGGHAHRDVLLSKTSITGCTVHLVDEGMDTGAVLAQRAVPVFDGDDETSLSDRVKVEEHRLYPDVLTWIAEGRVHLTEEGILVQDETDRSVC